MEVIVQGEQLEQKEIDAYIQHAKEVYPDKFDDLQKLILKPDGEMIDIEYVFTPSNFQRIRRITGYLVGTVDRWNDGKKAELKDREKHIVE